MFLRLLEKPADRIKKEQNISERQNKRCSGVVRPLEENNTQQSKDEQDGDAQDVGMVGKVQLLCQELGGWRVKQFKI